MATIIISLVFCLSFFLSPNSADSAVFNIASGDVTGLIGTINAANSNGQENVINLAPGTYTLTAADNNSSGLDPNGLPVIMGAMTINGESAETTVIERANGVPEFRIFEIAASANVTMNGITVRRGSLFDLFFGQLTAALRGGGILNFGNLTVNRCIIERNFAGSPGDGGGIANLGTVAVINSIIAHNEADYDRSLRGGNGGGLENSGTAIIQNSTITENLAARSGGGLGNGGTMKVSNSTIANNTAFFAGAGINGGMLTTIMNSTISGNTGIGDNVGPVGIPVSARGGGIFGPVVLRNSILALNTVTGPLGSPPALGPDCFGSITSLGNNIIGDPSDCSTDVRRTVFRDRVSFNAAIDTNSSFIKTVEGWDTYPAGTIFPNGSTVNGITYHVSTGEALVVNTGLSLSPPNNLFQTADFGFRPLIDTFTFAFDRPINAFGITFSSTFANKDGDYLLTTDLGDVIRSFFDPLFPGFSLGQFAGFTSTSPIHSVTISSTANALYGMDDLIFAVIEPPADLIGDPGLGAFIDDGAPGNGRFPLLPGSPAIDAGNDAACLATDQLDTPRLGACDIGAIEFYPVVNDLVVVGTVSTDFDATPVPGGPAGVFRVTTDFTNRSNQGIVNPFVEVVELTGGNLLLNADGGAGGVGARLTLPDSATTPFQPGASSTVEFLIGLQQREPFTFFVNMLGDPGTSSPSVSMQWKSQPSSR